MSTEQKHRNRRVLGLAGFGLLFAGGAAVLFGLERGPDEDAIARDLGVKVQAVRLTAAGYMLDVRYEVLDEGKAASMIDRRLEPFLIDEASGQRLPVPSSPKLGPIRQIASGARPIVGQTYFVLFKNPGRMLEPGAKVTLVLGEHRAEHLEVL